MRGCKLSGLVGERQAEKEARRLPWESLAWLSAAAGCKFPRPGSMLTSTLPLEGHLTAPCLFPPLRDGEACLAG